ncbi:MAG: alanine--tRNA ligase [Candidatus Bathyarchaeota archaeon]|nr:alanine--tRNA ligase [Candidatus Bathyarchaeota archaeon]
MSGMLNSFPAEEYKLPFFIEEGFSRRRCPSCGEYFWAQGSEQETCGESTSDGCACYSFLNNPPTLKRYSLSEMREAFLSFFEKQNHTRIKPYPVVARWREDIYLTHASIIDFQPYVTDGIVPPPANPLVIAQPCIRLVDISNTGPTFGRHLTIFEMGGHHAFNYPDKEVYWKDNTVRYHHKFMTEILGVKSEEVVYKESVWVGGGNAGPDVECIIRGLEVATLVFMQYKVVNSKFFKLPIRTVDTGYGLDRLAWLSQGVPSCFHAIYGNLLDKIFSMANLDKIDDKLLLSVARHSGLVTIDKNANRLIARKKVAERVGLPLNKLEKILTPIENTFAIADHTKCLSFLLSEGIVPSNIKEGYLARMLFRRTYRLLQSLKMEPEMFYKIISMQVDFWSKDYAHIKKREDEIIEMIKVEEEKFKDTIKRGRGKIERIVDEIKDNKRSFPNNKLSELYDSHGITPEMVKKIANEKGVKVEIPTDFYASIANRHLQTEKLGKEEKILAKEKIKIDELPSTDLLYYDDAYIREFEAKILNVINGNYLVLNRTAFYPEGGGQPADSGFLLVNKKKIDIIDVQKKGNVVLHEIKGSIEVEKGTVVHGVLDWDKRYALMRAHTATHLINGAARRVLGDHVWQHGAQKGVSVTRIDITHYRRLSPDEIHKIETFANQVILAEIEVETASMSRNKAESLYGFRLYQGGAVPGKDIRVVRTGDWDVEACGGTHLKNTREMGFIKIVYTERIQDGVERLGYSTGLQALANIQKNEGLLWKVSEILESPVDKLDKTAVKLVKELKRANSQNRKLIKELATKESATLKQGKLVQLAKKIKGIRIIERDFEKKINLELMVQTANEIIKQNEATVALFFGANKKTANILVMAGKVAVKKGINACFVVNKVSPIIGGGGGGRANFAQGGGTKPEKIREAIQKAKEIIEKQIQE